MASTSIGTAFVKQYGSTIDLLLQTMGGKFDGKCLEDSIVGEEKYYDQLGAVYANEIIDRYGDTPLNDITHDRRRLVATPYDVGLMFDTMDKVQMLVNPESQYVQQMVTALKRKKDIEFIKGALGTAYSGKAGGTSNDLAAANVVDEGGTLSLNADKILNAKYTLENANVDLDDPMNKPYIAVSPHAINSLLTSTQVTSADYNTVRALAKGEINTWLGFEFVVSNLLPYTTDGANQTVNLSWDSTDAPEDVGGATNIRACFAWVKSGIRRAVNPEVTVDVSQRKDKRNNWQSYACMRTGAVRMEEGKVVVIGCDEDDAIAFA